MSTNRELFFKVKKQLPYFKEHRVNDAELYQLLIQANGFNDYTELVDNFDNEIKNFDLFERNIKRINSGEPIQYVIGKTNFLDIDIFINHNVLIPRPETEGLALLVKEYILNFELKKDIIADVCTGSGCIALFLKKYFHNSIVYGSDKFEDPLIVASRNKELLDIDINLIKGSRLQPFIENNIKLDVLVSNPPYVENVKDIDDNVLRYEPMTAVFSVDGLHFYDSYFRHYKECMNEQFFMAFEINYDQKKPLIKLINKYFEIEKTQYVFKKDIYGKDRYLFIFGGYNLENLN